VAHDADAGAKDRLGRTPLSLLAAMPTTTPNNNNNPTTAPSPSPAPVAPTSGDGGASASASSEQLVKDQVELSLLRAERRRSSAASPLHAARAVPGAHPRPRKPP
jgi:hypothetical protein